MATKRKTKKSRGGRVITLDPRLVFVIGIAVGWVMRGFGHG
jgi:hypothetical protein